METPTITKSAQRETKRYKEFGMISIRNNSRSDDFRQVA